jgi:hypothetical protein
MRKVIVVGTAMAALLVLAPAALATTPGPPNVDVEPPRVIIDDRGEASVLFDPGLILFTYTDGSQTSCVIDPTLPPNPCSELAGTPGPPNVEVVPPEAVLGDDGEFLGFVPGSVRITFADGTERVCILDPTASPSGCAESVR